MDTEWKKMDFHQIYNQLPIANRWRSDTARTPVENSKAR